MNDMKLFDPAVVMTLNTDVEVDGDTPVALVFDDVLRQLHYVKDGIVGKGNYRVAVTLILTKDEQ